MIGIPPEALAPLGGLVFVLIFTVVAFTRGWVVARRTMDDVVHDRDNWRTEARLKDQTITELTDQNRELIEVGRTVKAIFTAISRDRSDEVSP